jgi:ketosteroid isomerase-like protein
MRRNRFVRRSVLVFGALTLAGLVLATAFPSAANDPRDEKAVIAALDTWRSASVKRDVATLEKVLHPDLMLGHSNGIEVESKAEVLKNAVSYPDWEPIELDIRNIRIYNGVALVKGIMAYRLKGAKQNNGYRNALFVLVKDEQLGWRIVERHPIPLRSAPPPK